MAKKSPIKKPKREYAVAYCYDCRVELEHIELYGVEHATLLSEGQCPVCKARYEIRVRRIE